MDLRLESVSVFFRSGCALDAVSLTFDRPGIVALVGANGAGKTTLLRVASGSLVPQLGTVRVDGEVLVRGRVDLRRRIAFMPDSAMPYGHWTPLRYAASVLRLYEADGPGAEKRVLDLLRAFGAIEYAERALGDLSRGELYKSCLVPLLASGAPLVLLDEPFASGMDPQGIEALESWVRGHTKNGGTVVYSTQWLDLAARFSDRTLVVDHGRVKAFLETSEIPTRLEGSDPIFDALRREVKEAS
ncbi:MAG: ABC transporter ATP-binding protein [Polyangiales bacterium]